MGLSGIAPQHPCCTGVTLTPMWSYELRRSARYASPALWYEKCADEIITVEGIRGKNGLLHPVQQAFVDEAAIQCGFCTPGLVLTGVELVNSGKRYTREQLREKISGHLCRCTGYENILNALEKVVGVDSQPTA